ncbi:MAG: ATP-binding protein, partial [Verrucomicrobia bacterium]|nr:ATP-binding protein [Verrucomicrobiota bacterium]
TDITEKKSLETQLLRTQRMESIGTLAGGIAHDLNNVLTPIMMAVQLIQMKRHEEDENKMLKSIEISAQRGADMVKQVLAFARGQEGEKVVLQLKHIVREMEKIARETFPKSIEVKSFIATDLQPIKGDATQLHQVLLNLCVNARDAMPEGGSISIKAENVSLDETAARRILNAKPGPYVSLRVTDSGSGIPPEIIDRIFEPFFTTKEVGKGTGLGLSTVLSIIKNHAALLDLTSEVGKGTTFNLLFPPAEGMLVQKESGDKRAAQSGQGHLVLVVDDEPLIRTLVEAVLSQNGYRVLQAEDGLKGVEIYTQHAAEISVAMVDMMMPGLDGTKTMKAMRQIRPDVKLIAISGMMQAGESGQEKDGDKVAVLKKPFNPEKVLETLDKVLGEKK